MFNLSGAVELHKKQIQGVLASSELTLEIQLPDTKTSSGVNPLYGNLARETINSGTVYGPFNCLWYDAISLTLGQGSGLETVSQKMAGQYTDATAFAELWLADILVDITAPNGKTYLDQAKHVIYDGQFFKVMGYIRTGLPTTAPYICLVALKGESNYES